MEENDFELNISFDTQENQQIKSNKKQKLKKTKVFKQVKNNNQNNKNNKNNNNQNNNKNNQNNKNNNKNSNQNDKDNNSNNSKSSNNTTTSNNPNNNKNNNNNNNNTTTNKNNNNNKLIDQQEINEIYSEGYENNSNNSNINKKKRKNNDNETLNIHSNNNNIDNHNHNHNNHNQIKQNKQIKQSNNHDVNKNILQNNFNLTQLLNHTNKNIKSQVNIVEDPHQYHAKPKDLSKNALQKPQAKSTSNYIFTETTFSSLGLDQRLSDHLEKSRENGGLGLTTTTRIQNVVIPSLKLERKNILMKSETGSGKTLAYLLPIMNDLMTLPLSVNRTQGTYAVILAPTRELCSQISDVLESLTKCCVSIVGGCIIGGEKRKSEKARLRKGVNIVVGTPGRFLDHIRATESFNLNNMRWFVLDEADRLLDMGFGQTILEICSKLTGRQYESTKDSELQKNEKTNNNNNSNSDNNDKSKEARTNLQNKWQQQSLQRSKLCRHPEELCFVMASATLTTAVKQLAMPLMSGNGFLVIDAEKQRVDQILNINDLINLGKDNGRLDGKDISNLEKQSQIDNEINENENENDEGDNNNNNNTLSKPLSGDSLVKGEVMQAPEQLSQYFMMATCKWRLAGLLSFLQLHKDEKIMVFFSTCDGVDYHSLLVSNTIWPEALDPIQFSNKSGSNNDGGNNNNNNGNSFKPIISQSLEPLEYTFTGMFGTDCPMYRLHGNVPQRVRQQVYKSFCKADKGILFCTDVAARGLDLPKVDWIVQYDPPCETTDYVHRIGRTARKGMGGSSLIFLLPTEAQYIQLLESYSLTLRPLSLQSLFYQVSKYIPSAKKFTNVDEMTAVIIQRRIENTVFQNQVLLSAGKQSFCSFIRAYATHSSDAKGIFQIQLLHLGHVAKSFGLSESPSNLRFKDDVIGRIFNGHYRKELVESESKLTKAKRNEKYALSKQNNKRKNENNDYQDKKIQKTESNKDNNKDNSSNNKDNSNNNKGMKQKIRQIGLTASGSFRKTNGYFRKKLRSEGKSEFQN